MVSCSLILVPNPGLSVHTLLLSPLALSPLKRRVLESLMRAVSSSCPRRTQPRAAVRTCTHMHIHAHVCTHMHTYAHICSRMLAYTPTCALFPWQASLPYAQSTYSSLPSLPLSLHHSLSTTTLHHSLSTTSLHHSLHHSLSTLSPYAGIFALCAKDRVARVLEISVTIPVYIIALVCAPHAPCVDCMPHFIHAFTLAGGLRRLVSVHSLCGSGASRVTYGLDP